MSHSSKAVSFPFLSVFISLVFLIILLCALNPLLGLRFFGVGWVRKCFYQKDDFSLQQDLKPV